MSTSEKNPVVQSSLLANLSNPYRIPPTETEAEYFEQFGRFIASYAAAEASVHDLARGLSKLSEEKARVIFAGMRLGDLTERIRAMARADKIEEETVREIDVCLIQLDKIADVRNKLVHRSVHFFDGKFIVTNAMTAKTVDGLQSDVVSKGQLEEMRSDCLNIFLRLIDIARPFDKTAEFPGLPEFRQHIKRPWRYVPAPPDDTRKRRSSAQGSAMDRGEVSRP